MRERARNKREAEEQRLFYVATTRARDRLILSGSLNEKGKAEGWLGWLFDALGISGRPSEDELLYPIPIQAPSSEEDTPTRFDLPVRIIQSSDELDVAEEEQLTPPPSTEFPAYHINPLIPSSVNKIFSVAELTAYVHCPTRFYLQHQIQVPPSEPRSEEAAETDRRDANHFLNSRVREIALNADEVYRERHIHAEIGSHIVDGIADRLFRDSRGLWRVINYERDRIDWEEIDTPADYYRSQIELYALLVHRLHPEQQVIPVTICSTDLAAPYSMEITREKLADIENTWLERIEAMQVVLNTDAIGVGRFEKNREHCSLCPYFVEGECMVAD